MIRYLLLILLLAACHDAKRDNLFDPELTPAVELSVALDDTAGTATLTWSQYAGEAPFAEYHVLRNVAQSIVVDTLARIAVTDSTRYVDTALSPDTAYEYRIAVVNADGLNIPSNNHSVAGFSIGPVDAFTVDADADAGALVLRWRRYIGAGFEGYRVWRRRELGGIAEEMDHLVAIGDTVWTDTTALASEDYFYSIVVDAASRQLESSQRQGRWELSPVRITLATGVAATATAALTWTPYTGPHFARYHVIRRVAGLAEETIAQTADVGQTAFVDSGLIANTAYDYFVQLETSRGERAVSNIQTVTLHPLVDIWDPDVTTGPTGRSSRIKLYTTPAQRLTVLLANLDRWRLRSYATADGSYLEQTMQPAFPGWFEPRGAALVLSGDRYLAAMVETTILEENGLAFLQRLDRDLNFVFNPEQEAFPGLATDAASRIKDRLAGELRVSFDRNVGLGQIVVNSEEGLVFSEDFAGDEFAAWDEDPSSILNSARLRATHTTVLGIGPFDEGWVLGVEETSLRKAGLPGNDWDIEVVFLLFRDDQRLQVQLGNSAPAEDRLLLSVRRDGLSFDLTLEHTSWERDTNDSLHSSVTSWRTVTPEWHNLYARLRLQVVDGQPRVLLQNNKWVHVGSADPTGWQSLAKVDDGADPIYALAQDKRLMTVNSAGEILSDRQFEGAPISDLRVWRDDAGKNWIGLCRPADNQVFFKPIGTPSLFALGGGWPGTGSVHLGSGPGPDPGELIFPLALAGSADRIYVLDAGNGRIQVFDYDGNYITQWGSEGSGDGQFDFGSGLSAEDYVGSIAVDDDGFIYVADRSRIQKFAP